MFCVSLPGAPSEKPDGVEGLHQLVLLKTTSAEQLAAMAVDVSGVKSVLGGKHTEPALIAAARQSWPQAEVYVYKGDRQWQVLQSAGSEPPQTQPQHTDTSDVLDGAIAPEPDQTLAKDVNSGEDKADAEKQAKKLVRDCFLRHAWDETKHHAEISQMQGRFELLLEQHPALECLQADWLKSVQQGREACRLASTLNDKLKSGESDEAIQAWVTKVSANTAQRIAKNLEITFEKGLEHRRTQRQKRKQTVGYKPSMPELQLTEQGHPNAIANLKPSPQWTLLIDETGLQFGAEADLLGDTDIALGKVVGLLLPQGVTLPPLAQGFHAKDQPTQQVEQVLGDLLKHQVGVLGFTSKDPISGRVSWFQKIEQLVRWVLQLLPMQPEQVTRVDVQIEQRSGFTPKTDLGPVGELLLTSLMEISPERFRNLRLNMAIIDKDGHPANGYVDTIANCWGSPDKSRKKLLKLTKLPGHCLIRPNDDAVYERLLLALESRSALRPADWYNLLQVGSEQLGKPTTLVYGCMQNLGQQVQTDAKLWQGYLAEVQVRLRNKEFQLSGLSQTLGWLEEYQPVGSRWPGSLELQLRSARLALLNHQGHSDNEALLKLFERANHLRDEMAPIACEAILRVVVSATNAMDFKSCEDILDQWLDFPAATVGLLNRGKLLSTKGQLLAFQQRAAEADGYFADAMGVFDRLSDQVAAKKDIQQTRTYRLFNRLRLGLVTDDDFRSDLRNYLVEAVPGKPNRPLFERMACTGQDLRFVQQLALRALFERADTFQDEMQHVVAARDEWQSGEDHPWPLIDFWRGWCLWQQGEADDAREYWLASITACGQAGGITLEWMSAVLRAVAAALCGDVSVPSESTRSFLRHGLPLAQHSTLDLLCDEPVQDNDWLLQQLAICLPFNFH